MLLVDLEQFVGGAGFEGGEFAGFGVGVAGLAGFPAGGGGGRGAGLLVCLGAAATWWWRL